MALKWALKVTCKQMCSRFYHCDGRPCKILQKIAKRLVPHGHMHTLTQHGWHGSKDEAADHLNEFAKFASAAPRQTFAQLLEVLQHRTSVLILTVYHNQLAKRVTSILFQHFPCTSKYAANLMATGMCTHALITLDQLEKVNTAPLIFNKFAVQILNIQHR